MNGVQYFENEAHIVEAKYAKSNFHQCLELVFYQLTMVTIITDHVLYCYASDQFIYGSLALTLGVGTVYYINRFNVLRQSRLKE